MKDAKLVKTFKTLSNEEFRYLRRFVQSEFFNTDPNPVLLLDALAKHYPSFESKALDREVLYKKLFPGQAYNDAKWRNLVFKLNKLTEEYLLWLELEKSEITRHKLLINAYGRRNLYTQFEKNTTELSETLASQSGKRADARLERMQVNLKYYHHPQTIKVENLSKLQSAMEDLDSYYFAEKLRLACDLKVAENMVAGASSILLIHEVSATVQEAGSKASNYLRVYERIFNLLVQHPTMAFFQEVFDFFREVEPELSDTDRQFALLHLLNFAINQVNKGENDFRPEVLRLYKMGLEQGALITEGTISENTFVNIVSTAAGLKEFTWADQFIQDYEKYLSEAGREEVTHLSLGFLYFYQHQYDRVVDLLYNFTFQDFNKSLFSKTLLLRCYFELLLKDSSYYSVFSSYTKAFDKFVKREKQLSLTKKIWYKNLIAKMLYLAKNIYDHKWNKAVKAKFIAEIESQPMILKAWILERIKTL